MAKKKGKPTNGKGTFRPTFSVDTNDYVGVDAASRHVRFNSNSSSDDAKVSNGVLKKTATVQGSLPRSPSSNTLNRIDRETYVLWKRPIWTPIYCVLEILCLLWDFLNSLLHWRRLVPTVALMGAAMASYLVPGPHTEWALRFEPTALWCAYWIWLGVLSSIGFGSGLHTFVLFLGPHIAKVTLAAYECNSLDFPEPPYPTDVTCPTDHVSPTAVVSLWHIISKVRLESLMWGLGTALGELPPYFMARAARISGTEVEDEEYQEYLAFKNGLSNSEEQSLFGRWKIRIEQQMENMIKRIGFPGILVLASVPNPFFDLAGMTCGHFLIPFWSFFGATAIGKAVIKMHIQMLFVVLLFSERHLEEFVKLLKLIPRVGEYIQVPLKGFIDAQKARLHRKPDDPILEEATNVLQLVMNCVVIGMVLIFLLSLVQSMAQAYHKRRCEAQKKKAQ